MRIVRPPSPALSDWISELFVRSDEPRTGAAAPALERTLPTGRMHCVLRLADPAIHVRDPDRAESLGHSVVAGARSRYYLRDLPPAFVTVGAMLKPGASLALFGVPADVLAERHTRLDALWGSAAVAARDRVGDAATGEAQLRAFEAILEERLKAQRPRALSPLVRFALARLETRADVAAVVRESGYSHRVFTTRFAAEVGLTPKRYCRVLRFQRAVTALEQPTAGSIAEVAARVGFSDQAHLDRDFREMAGLTPSAVRGAGGSNSSKPRPRRG